MTLELLIQNEVPGIEWITLLPITNAVYYPRLLVHMEDGREVQIAFGGHWLTLYETWPVEPSGAYRWLSGYIAKVLRKALDEGLSTAPPDFGRGNDYDSWLYPKEE